MRLKDLYARLGLTRNATHKEIKSAYYKLSKQVHPDRNDGCAKSAQKFRDITEAYEILGNAASRNKYDKDTPSYAQKRPQSQQTQYNTYEDMNARDQEISEKIRFYREQMLKRRAYTKPKPKTHTYQYTRRTVNESSQWFNAHYGNEEFTWKPNWKKSSPNSSSFKSGGPTDESLKWDSFTSWQKQSKNEPFKRAPINHKDRMDFRHVYTDIKDFELQLRQEADTKEILSYGLFGLILFCVLCGLTLLIYEPDETEKDKHKK